MGIKTKSSKREISIENYRGRIRLRWRHEGDRYTLNLPHPYLQENLYHASIKSAEIKLDLMKGCFDSSLEKYKYIGITHNKLADSHLKTSNPQKGVTGPVCLLHDLVDRYNEWGTNIKNVDVENSVHHLYVRKLLERWVNMPIGKAAELLNREEWVVSTYNRRLEQLKDFFTWLVRTGVIPQNPLEDVCKRRYKKRKKNAKREPLTEEEILRLLNAIKEDTYCPVVASCKHSHYYPFLLFMFLTGVRNAEGIGLRVRHVDLEKGHIEISEVLARTIKGSNHAARISKGTKTDNVRYLPLTDDLRVLLVAQVEGKEKDHLVFPSPRGLSINDQMFEKRILKPVLRKLGLGNRDLYAARHSFGTRAVQQGMVVTDVAYLMGHSTIETCMRNYVVVGKPSYKLPTMAKGT